MDRNEISIVVIDDSRTTLMLMENLLRDIEQNIDIHLFDKPKRALKYLRNNKPNLIIIDLYMPEMSGIELLEQIEDLEDTTIFMMSVSTAVVKIEKAFELGVKEYFIKPLNIKKLKDKIIESIKNEKKYQT